MGGRQTPRGLVGERRTWSEQSRRSGLWSPNLMVWCFAGRIAKAGLVVRDSQFSLASTAGLLGPKSVGSPKSG